MNRYVYCFIVFILPGFFSEISGQTLTLSVQKDTISFNENAVVTITGEVRDFQNYATLPDIDGLIVTHTTFNYSFNSGNGRLKISQSFVLQPVKDGTFTIGPAWIQAGSKRVFSNKAKITVVKTSATTNNDLVFLRCEPNKTKVYNGEMITLTLRLYHRVDLRLSSDRPFAKSFSGFFYRPGTTDAIYEDTVITQNGMKYVGETLYKEYVFPNSVGQLALPSYEYTCFIPYNPFGNDYSQDILSTDKQIELESSPVIITVLPLPERDTSDAPCQDVGIFSMSAGIEKGSTKNWEPLKFTVTLRGEGDFPLMQAPLIEWPEGIKAELRRQNDSVTEIAKTYKGEKTFEWLLTPNKEGKYVIPGLSYTYFDPYKKEYVTLKTPDFDLEVTPGESTPSEMETNMPDGFDQIDSGTWYRTVPLILLIVLLVPGVWWIIKRRKKNDVSAPVSAAEESQVSSQEETVTKTDIQIGIAWQNISLANDAASQQQYARALYFLHHALILGIIHKTGLKLEEISSSTVRYRLKLKGCSPEFTEEAVTVLERLAVNRYLNSAHNREIFDNESLLVSSILKKLS